MVEYHTGNQGRPKGTDTIVEKRSIYCWLDSSSTHSVPNAIDIKGGVDNECIIEDIIPDITVVSSLDRVSWKRKKAGWRVRHVLIHVSSVITLDSLPFEVCHECLTERH